MLNLFATADQAETDTELVCDDIARQVGGGDS